jgi:hypothetical protein
MVKVSILTPTIFRSTLWRNIESVDSQTFKDFEHLVFFDTGSRFIFDEPHRKSFCAAEPFNDFGNTPRHLLYQQAAGDYLVYLDDDVYFSDPDALRRLVVAFEKCKTPWAYFPMNRMGSVFCNEPPGRYYTDMNQVITKRVMPDGIPAQFQVSKEYEQDGIFIDWLTQWEYSRLDIDPPVIYEAQNRGLKIMSEQMLETCCPIQGWMSDEELIWLFNTARNQPAPATWIELGVFCGRSLMATGLGLPPGSTLIGVDNFMGPPPSHDVGLQDICWIAGRTVDLLQKMRPDLTVQIVVSDVLDAVSKIPESFADVIFFDADHSYESLSDQINRWEPKLKDGGLLCGHDYLPQEWPGVEQAVTARFGKGVHTVGTIWVAG